MKEIQFEFNDFTFISTFNIDHGAKGDYFTPDDAPDIIIKKTECLATEEPVLWPDEYHITELIKDQEEL